MITETEIFIGRRLKFLRDYNNMTCQMLADTAGVSKQAISKFENGELNPSNRMFKLLCEIFKIHPTFFTQRNLKIQFKDNKIIVLNESRITIAKMRDLEKQVLSGEISYSRMVEIINETLFTTS